jgi:hypothetical protein
MSINPTSPNGPNRPLDAAEAERSRARPAQSASPAPATSKEAVDPKDGSADSVQVSSEALDLAKTTGARPAKSSLPPERMQQIGHRLATGFYDRPDVVDELAKRLAKHRDLHRPE